MRIGTLLLISCLFQIAGAQVPFYPTQNISGHRFGSSVAVSGNDIVVSSVSTFLFPVTQGSVYVFEHSNGTLTQTANFAPSTILPTDGFGANVSIDNDIIAVGAPGHEGTGAVFIYRKNGTQWEFEHQLASPFSAPGGLFGTNTVIHDDLLLVAAPAAMQPGVPQFSGYVHIFQLVDTQWNYMHSMSLGNVTNYGEKIRKDGTTIIISGTTNSEGKKFVNYLLSTSSPEFGSAEQIISDFQIAEDRLYLLTRESQNQEILVIDYLTWDIVNTIAIPASDQIYTSLAVSGDKMFVGSSEYVLQMTRKFPVEYFRKVGSEWQYQYPIFGTAPDGDDNFGQALAIDGENLVIGAPQEGVVFATGNAYYLNTSTLSVTGFDSEHVVVYPNPATDSFTVKSDKNQTPEVIEIYSVAGKKLQQTNSVSSVDISHLQTGIYFARITFADGILHTCKIVKQ